MQALSLTAGNAFDGGMGQAGSGQVNTDYFLAIGYESPYASYPCYSGEGDFFYGDLEAIPFLDDCANPKPAPWNRSGLLNNSPLPGGFALPAPGEWENDPGTTVVGPDVPSIRVGPNPTRSMIYLTKGVELQIKGVKFFEVTGRLADQSGWQLSTDRSSVDVRELRTGIWYMQIECLNGSKEVYRVAVIR